MPTLFARVQLLVDDPFGVFLRAAVRRRPRRLTIVSPWVALDDSRGTSLRCAIERTERVGGSIVLVTREPASERHAEAIARVAGAVRNTVYINPRLHAKLFACEDSRGRDFAVVGSANATANSAHLDELALLVRPRGASDVIAELAHDAVRRLSSTHPTTLKEVS